MTDGFVSRPPDSRRRLGNWDHDPGLSLPSGTESDSYHSRRPTSGLTVSVWDQDVFSGKGVTEVERGG